MTRSPSTPIPDFRVYFVISMLRTAELDVVNERAYVHILKAWNKFMSGPDSLSAILLDEDDLKVFRTLESLANDVKAIRSHWGSETGRGMLGTTQDSVRSRRNGPRKPNGYWKEKRKEIAALYAEGATGPALATMFGTSAAHIYILAAQGRE